MTTDSNHIAKKLTYSEVFVELNLKLFLKKFEWQTQEIAFFAIEENL